MKANIFFQTKEYENISAQLQQRHGKIITMSYNTFYSIFIIIYRKQGCSVLEDCSYNLKLKFPERGRGGGEKREGSRGWGERESNKLLGLLNNCATKCNKT